MKLWPAPPEPGTPLWKRPAAWVLVVVVAVFGFCGVFLVFAGKEDTSVASPGGQRSSAIPSAPAPAPDDISSERVNDPPPTSTPNGWDWTPTKFANIDSPSYMIALPSSPLYGPRLSDGAYKAGWDHSALGALGAASQLVLLTQTDVREAQSHIVDGPNKAAVVKDASTMHSMPADIYPVYTGFRFLNYSPDAASIQLLTSQGPTKKSLLCTVGLQWINNDWRAQAAEAPHGPCMGSVQVDPSQPGFIPWGPTS